MQYRKFGKLDWKVSALGFGAMRLPILNKEPAKINEPEAIKMIRYAIDHGVNYVDTAYMYMGGNSEKLVGAALKDGYREKVKVATKMPVTMAKAPADFDRIFEEQFNRLQVGKIDFYLLHGLNAKAWATARDMGIIKWAEKRMAAGQIGRLGFSFHDNTKALKEIIDAYDNWVLSQVQYNFMDIDRQAGTKGVEYAAKKGLAVVVMEPLRGGLLAKNPPAAVGKVWDTIGGNRSRIEWALQWVWNHPEVSVALSGMGTMEQVVQNVEYAGRSGPNTLSPEELDVISRVRETYKSLIPISCTACRYCMPCPNGVEIPGIFEIYNDVTMYEDKNLGDFRYNRGFGLKPEQRADKCIECKQCEEKCPQQLPITKLLKKCHEALTAKP
jgi:predicted aldo/keto reductase-like oxidoreductase